MEKDIRFFQFLEEFKKEKEGFFNFWKSAKRKRKVFPIFGRVQKEKEGFFGF
jgi:hypothetical protein